MPLTKSDTVGTWIKDFRKSDAPQFKGKTDKEKRDMAVAAYLAKKREQKEAVSKAPKIGPDSLKVIRAKDKAMKPAKPKRMTSTQKSLAQIRQRAEEVELDEVLDTPKAMQSYRDKARASKEKAASSAVAKINKGMEKGYRTHPAGELKTIAKRAAGERMANKKSTTNEEDDFGKNFGKRIGMLMKGGKGAEYLKKKADQSRQRNKALDPGAAKKGLGIGVIDKDKANKKRMAREEVEIDEASTVNGVTKKPGEKTWKSTSMSRADAVKMHGKDNVRIGPRKTRLGKDDVQVHVEAREPSMAKIHAILNPTKNAEQGVQALMKSLKVDRKTAQSHMDKAIGSMKEGRTNTADKKPEVYTDPNTGKTKIRMIPVRKDIVREVSADKADAAATERRKRMNKALDAGDLNKANRESDKMKKNVGYMIKKVAKSIKKESVELDEKKKLTGRDSKGHYRATEKGAGMTAKGVAAARRKNPGSKLQTAVTTPPSKLDPDSKAAKRRKSFCARSRGWTGERGKAARRRWNC